MGHEIRFDSFDSKLSQSDIIGECQHVAERFSDGGGLPCGIRFKETIFEDYDAAREWLENNVINSYENVAVKFREYKTQAISKKLENLDNRIEKERTKMFEYSEKNAIKNHKSKLIGCPKCGSKVNVKYVANTCPVCHNELRSKTVLDALNRYRENIKTLTKNRTAEIRKINKKREKQAEIKWLVRYEYHI